VVVERQVPVNKYVDKVIKRSIIKPVRKEVKVKEITVDKPVVQDVYVEKKVEKKSIRYVDVPEIQYKDIDVVKGS